MVTRTLTKKQNKKQICLTFQFYIALLCYIEKKNLCADLLQHGHVSDRPALEGRPSVALNLDELVFLSLRSLNVGHLQTEAGAPS